MIRTASWNSISCTAKKRSGSNSWSRRNAARPMDSTPLAWNRRHMETVSSAFMPSLLFSKSQTVRPSICRLPPGLTLRRTCSGGTDGSACGASMRYAAPILRA